MAFDKLLFVLETFLFEFFEGCMVLLVVLIEGFLRLGQQLPGSPPSDDTLYLRYDNFKVGRLLAFECGHPVGLRSTEVQPHSAAARGDEMRKPFFFCCCEDWQGLFFPMRFATCQTFCRYCLFPSLDFLRLLGAPLLFSLLRRLTAQYVICCVFC